MPKVLKKFYAGKLGLPFNNPIVTMKIIAFAIIVGLFVVPALAHTP